MSSNLTAPTIFSFIIQTQQNQTEEQKADRLIAETLQKMKWTTEDLKLRPKGNATKARLAQRF